MLLFYILAAMQHRGTANSGVHAEEEQAGLPTPAPPGTATPQTVLGFTSGLSGSAPWTVGWSYGRSVKSHNTRRIGKSFISILKAGKHCQGFQKYWKVSFKSKYLFIL